MAVLSLALVASVSLIGADRIVLRDRHIRMRDVAAGVGRDGPGRNDPASLVIASVPEGVVVTTLSRRAIASLIARRLPGVRVDIGSAIRPVTFRLPARQRAAGSACQALADARAAGQLVTADVLRPAACAGADPRALRFDRRAGQLVAAVDLAEGAKVGRVAPPPTPAIRRGEALRLIARDGPVSVERPVTAMQAGRAARAVFVRDADGQVFAVRVAAR